MLLLSLKPAFSQTVHALPTPQQLAWHEMEFYWFIHFGPNTFTDKEWGHGDEPEDVFNPAKLDCRQWARIAKQSGAKGIIITAKHHDGFCLWPSKYSKHTVRESKWKNGKGDVLRELSNACKEYGLKFGVYLSPWDRNHPQYGTEAYNDVYVNTMAELIRNYGPLFEFWWDGANGEGPNGKKQVYDFRRFENMIRTEAPNTVVFSDIGPDVRWVGNEKGIAGETNWNYLDTAGFKRGLGAPADDTLRQGNVFGKNWIPAECDVSIRPGWFYHPGEDNLVKSGTTLFDLYLKSVGRGSNLLLNVPPDRNGLITAADSIALMDFKRKRDKAFENNLAKRGEGSIIAHAIRSDDGVLNDGNNRTGVTMQDEYLMDVSLRFNKVENVNCVVLQEDLTRGQACKRFSLFLYDEEGEKHEIKGTTIGRKRILTFPTMRLRKIGLRIEEQLFPTTVSEIGAYLIPE